MISKIMRTLLDINVTKLDKGKIAANLGDAHEHIAAGILIRLGFDVGIVDVHGTPYDMMIIGFENPGGKKITLRAQVKTADDSISFIGGSRGGIDREYKSGVKTYKYTTEHSDLILGVDKSTLDIFVVPSRYLANWGGSRATSKLQLLRNNWDILLNWNVAYLSKLQGSL
jgi:hypothetical protein